jgi:DnaJ-class molecular chaperone
MDVTRAQSTLGVSDHASYAEVRRAYRRQLRAHHPDTGDGDPRALDQIRTAYRELAPAAPRTIVPGTYGYGRPQARPQLVDLYA